MNKRIEDMTRVAILNGMRANAAKRMLRQQAWLDGRAVRIVMPDGREHFLYDDEVQEVLDLAGKLLDEMK